MFIIGGGPYLLAYVLGLILGPWVDPHPAIVFLPFLPLLFLPLFFGLSFRRYAARLIPVICLLFIGLAQYHLSMTPPVAVRLLLERSGQEVVVQGSVTHVDVRHDGRVRCDLRVSQLFEDKKQTNLGPVDLRVHIWENPPVLRVGQTLRATVRLRQPRNFGTPGEFDYVRYLARRGIFVTASVKNGDAIAILSEPPAALFSLIERWRELCGMRISDVLPPPVAALTRALVLGDRGQVRPEERQLLAKSGVAHLFAVSGLHLGLVAGWLYLLLLFLWRRSEPLLFVAPPARYLPVAILPLLAVYLCLAGAGMSLQRAFLMFCGGAFLMLMRRRIAPLQLLICALLILLLLDPLALFEPALQLSAAGVAGIVIAIPRWRHQLAFNSQLLRFVAGLSAVTLAATLATAPLILWHFHQLTFLGLLTNIIAVPLIGGAAIPLMLLGALCAPFNGVLADVFFVGGGILLSGMLDIVEFALQIFPASGTPYYVAAWQVALCALLTWSWLLPSRWRIMGTAVGLMLVVILYVTPDLAQDRLTLTAFSVGQGESLLLSLPDGQHYLIDGGGLYGDSFDVGERLLAPALGRLGVRELTAVILTHAHPDHYKGLKYILEHFPVAEFWCRDEMRQLPQILSEVLVRRDIKHRSFDPGWHWIKTETDLQLSVLAPTTEFDDENDRSLVVYASNGDDGVLLTGDLEADGVAALLQAGVSGPVSLLKLPHHGSRYANPLELVSEFNPQMVFTSVGFDNRYGLPHPEIEQALVDRAIPCYRTDQHGTLIFSSRGSGWQVKYLNKQAFY